MEILGIKEYGIKKYQSGTQEGGIQKQSEEEKFNQYLEQMKKQYPGAYTDSTPIWSYIKSSKEIKSYNEFLNDLKSTNPEEYNRLMENAASSGTSEISKPWIDAKGNVRRSTNVGAGFVSGTDPVGALYVEGIATAPVFNQFGRLVGAGKNWVRSKILSTPTKNYQVSIGNPVQIKQGTNYFKDAYGREITPTPYPGTDAELLSHMNEAHLNILRDYFSPEKIKQLKNALGWGDQEIKEFQAELIRSIGYKNNIKTQVKGPEDGFTLIGSHKGGLLGSGDTALGIHDVTLNRARIPNVQMAQEAIIHELGAHGKTASMKATDFGAGGLTDKAREAFPRMAELVQKNEELANDLLVLNRRGQFFNQFKNVGDLEKYFVKHNLSWNDKWSKFNDKFKYFRYTTSPQEKMARAYTGQLYNKVYDPTKKTLNIEQLENFYTPESVEAFKKAVLGVTPLGISLMSENIKSNN